MKKIFIIFSFIFISIFSFVPTTFSLTDDEQTHVDYFISNYYDIDNFPKCIFSYKLSSSTSESYIVCVSEEVSSTLQYYKTSSETSSMLKIYATSSERQVIWLEKNLSTNEFELLRNQNFSATYSGVPIKDIFPTYYNNFDIYLYPGSSIYKTKDISFEPVIKHIVSFIIPDGSTLVVKDSTGTIIEPLYNLNYSLQKGHYSYSVYNSAYHSKENIDFVVEKDSTIDIELESKFNSNNMQSIFTQYYNYIKYLVSDLFPLENPLFLYVATFIIGFSIIAIIKKLIGGLF